LVASNGARDPSLNGTWSIAPADTSKVTLSWYDGLSGTFLNLRVAGDSLIGSGESASDLPEVTPYSAKAWGVRVPCAIE
jgi:hypothetical protein